MLPTETVLEGRSEETLAVTPHECAHKIAELPLTIDSEGHVKRMSSERETIVLSGSVAEQSPMTSRNGVDVVENVSKEKLQISSEVFKQTKAHQASSTLIPETQKKIQQQ